MALERAASYGIQWWVWRLVVSPDVRASLPEVRYQWAFADVLEAHVVLDALEKARQAMMPDKE
jgi:hypothetical protein